MAQTYSILLFGGASEERLVSVASAQNLCRNYNFKEIWFLQKDGAICSTSKEELLAQKNPFEQEFQPATAPFIKSIEQATGLMKDKVVFLGFHGTEGEDGTFQEIFEKAHVAFTGSGSKSSRLSFEKNLAKEILAENSIAVAAQMILARDFKSAGENGTEALQSFLRENKKIVIKPLANGSSIGLHIVSDEAALQKALASIREKNYGPYLVEKFISGRELTVGVIQTDAGLKVLPPSEVILDQGHSFDYQGKYLGRGTTEITPANLTQEEVKSVQKLALEAHQHLGCFGYTRTDIMLTASGPVFIETNTLPGLSSASFIPQQLKAAGIPFAEFIEKQMQLGTHRFEI